jgi:hypothetical protein
MTFMRPSVCPRVVSVHASPARGSLMYAASRVDPAATDCFGALCQISALRHLALYKT